MKSMQFLQGVGILIFFPDLFGFLFLQTAQNPSLKDKIGRIQSLKVLVSGFCTADVPIFVHQLSERLRYIFQGILLLFTTILILKAFLVGGAVATDHFGRRSAPSRTAVHVWP